MLARYVPGMAKSKTAEYVNKSGNKCCREGW
ncbi:hypothetical protein WRSd3_00305 [Shigella dysenteriae WRSd3]|uniref:Uncharacterized protein n=2 Tax=Shigella dysenteriae TaxID=622 RepID=A0A090NNF9_SHIDY|nr:hypothetical protein Asd1617_05432 [Shigella dysenteriae 1617]ESU82101.1 hypothetical protein WRSd3_00305 [Shigella dysenteriae WRSd3]